MGDYYLKRTQHKITVGVVPVKFPTPAPLDTVTQPEAIFIQTIPSNTGKIWIGGSDVTADFAKGVFYLPAGLADAMLPFIDDENLYAISDVAGQTLMVTYLAGKA
jgi:hypothetical protein